jgi:hypothetical protein
MKLKIKKKLEKYADESYGFDSLSFIYIYDLYIDKS